jgi:hypothetical protein
MPTSVRLDSKTERLVKRLSRLRGVTKSDVLREAITVLSRQEESSRKTGRPYDAMKHLIGIADSGGQRLSENTGEKFYQMLVKDRARERRSR